MTVVTLDSPALDPIAATEPLFRAQGLTKTYHMGEVDVHALQRGPWHRRGGLTANAERVVRESFTAPGNVAR